MKIKLCNVHKLAVANEGEERKPIFIPFGTWPYDDMISQTLDKPHAEGIAADLDKQIAAGEPGIPVYQGHPDVPEYAGKYPDKGAMGWIKKILVNEDGMECQIEWDRDPGKGFGWFSPYWIGDKPVVGPDGKKNVIVDGLTSIGLVNNPNIREFRLANEAGENLTQRRGEAEVAAFKMPDHLLALAKRFDDRVALANVTDANGRDHVDAGSPEGGQFAPGTGTATSAYGKDQLTAKTAGGSSWHDASISNRIFHHVPNKWNAHLGLKDDGYKNRDSARHNINAILKQSRDDYHRATIYGRKNSDSKALKGDALEGKRNELRTQQAIHRVAILHGFKYNRATHQYE